MPDFIFTIVYCLVNCFYDVLTASLFCLFGLLNFQLFGYFVNSLVVVILWLFCHTTSLNFCWLVIYLGRIVVWFYLLLGQLFDGGCWLDRL
jgi:hypothetical protein